MEERSDDERSERGRGRKKNLLETTKRSEFFNLFFFGARENFIDERRRRNREEKNLKKKSKEERERERERADVVRNKRELRARLYPNFLFI